MGVYTQAPRKQVVYDLPYPLCTPSIGPRGFHGVTGSSQRAIWLVVSIRYCTVHSAVMFRPGVEKIGFTPPLGSLGGGMASLGSFTGSPAISATAMSRAALRGLRASLRLSEGLDPPRLRTFQMLITFYYHELVWNSVKDPGLYCMERGAGVN